MAAGDRAAMCFETTNLAFALAAYRLDNGGVYPEKLDALVPKYVKELPKDIFNNDADLNYSRKNGGYLLYSVGPNGIDDGGKGIEDRGKDKDCDDIGVQMTGK